MTPGLNGIRSFFSNYNLIIVPNGDNPLRVTSIRCVWGGPPLSFKFDLRPHYQEDTLSCHLLDSILNIGAPSWTDVTENLRALATESTTTSQNVEPFYAYIFSEFGATYGDTIRYAAIMLFQIHGSVSHR